MLENYVENYNFLKERWGNEIKFVSFFMILMVKLLRSIVWFVDFDFRFIRRLMYFWLEIMRRCIVDCGYGVVLILRVVEVCLYKLNTNFFFVR